MSIGLTDQEALEFHNEYGELKMTVEVVDDIHFAIQHINTFGRYIITFSFEYQQLFTFI
jgi:gamma-glutamyl phosphate reductase